jgi:hypothetical protein
VTRSNGKHVADGTPGDASGGRRLADAARCTEDLLCFLDSNPNHGGSHARETVSRTSGLGLVATAFKLNIAPFDRDKPIRVVRDD